MCPKSPTLVLGNKGALTHLTDDQVIDVVCFCRCQMRLVHACIHRSLSETSRGVVVLYVTVQYCSTRIMSSFS